MGRAPAPPPGPRPTAQEIQPALERTVGNTLVPLTLGLAFLFAIFGLTDAAWMDPAHARTIALYDLAMAATFVALAAAFTRWGAPRRHADAAVAGIAGLVALFGALVMAVRPEPIESVVFIMLVFGAGAVLLSYPWFAAVATVSVALWTFTAARAPPSEDWIQYGQALLSACVLSAIVLQVRRQAISRAERLRILEERARRDSQQTQQALEEAQRLAHIGNWSWDIPQDRVQWSAELYRLFGQRPDAGPVTYQRYLDLVHPDDRAHTAEQIQRAYETHAPFAFEHRVVWGDGSVHWIHGRGSVVVDEAGQAVRMLGTAQDIDERKRAQQEEREAQARIEEIERLRSQDAFKTQFINEVAHELNTPLTPIQLQLELLRLTLGTRVEPEQAQALQIIERNVQRFGALISDVLDAARLQGRNLGLRREDFDLVLLIREVAASFAPQAQRAGIDLQVHVPRTLMVFADTTRLSQVLYNLLSNAIKYSPHGGRIEVRAQQDSDQATVSVRDTGIGIKAEDLPRLFLPFSQTHDPGALKVKGTGLGLYVSRGLVELHQGRIWCESDGPGKGCTFAFQIPATRAMRDLAAEAPMPARARPDRAPALQG